MRIFTIISTDLSFEFFIYIRQSSFQFPRRIHFLLGRVRINLLRHHSLSLLPFLPSSFSTSTTIVIINCTSLNLFHFHWESLPLSPSTLRQRNTFFRRKSYPFIVSNNYFVFRKSLFAIADIPWLAKMRYKFYYYYFFFFR